MRRLTVLLWAAALSCARMDSPSLDWPMLGRDPSRALLTPAMRHLFGILSPVPISAKKHLR
jgi:hypothetical protein